MKQPEWNKFEAALLIEGYEQIESGQAPRNFIVEELSNTLRQLGRQNGLQIDDIYRNKNGIGLRLYELRYLFTDGQSGIMNTSHLFEKMVRLYQNDRRTFNNILSEAKSQINSSRKYFAKRGENLHGWTHYHTGNDANINYRKLGRTHEKARDTRAVVIERETKSPYDVLNVKYSSKEEEIKAIKERLSELMAETEERDIENAVKYGQEDIEEESAGKISIENKEKEDQRTAAGDNRQNGVDTLDEEYLSEIYGMDPEIYALLSIDDFGLSVRLKKRLDILKIHTIKDLLNTKRSDLSRIKGFGAGCFREIDSIMNQIKSPDFHYEIADKHYDLNKEIQPYIGKIKTGNFEFADVVGFSSRTASVIQRYKDAYEELGADLAGKAVSQDSAILAIRDAFNDYTREYVQESICRDAITKNIPRDRRQTKAENVIKGYSNDEETLERLLNLLADPDQTISELIVTNSTLFSSNENLLNNLTSWCKFDINIDLQGFFSNVIKKERSIEVIEMRASGMTLEDIGTQIGVTRERVRQIEKKVANAFNSWQHRHGILYKLLIHLDEENSFTPLEVIDAIQKYGLALVYLLKICDIKGLSYDKQLDIFVIDELSLTDNVQAYIDSLPDTFDEEKINEILNTAEDNYGYPRKLVNAALEDSYKKTGRVYHRSRLTLEKIYVDILKKYYPDGIHIYSEHSGIRNHVLNDYGIDISGKSNHAIEAVIARVCILRGRGVYKVRDNTTVISNRLARDIHDYIEKNPAPIFMTNTIFTIFEDRLLKEGIDNKYYLQGLLKDRFEDEWLFRRDYISKDANYTTIGSSIVEKIRKSKYPVDKEELQRAFPGVTEIVMNFATQDAGILNLFGEYLHSRNLKLSRRDIAYLHDAVEAHVRRKGYCSGHDIYNYISRDYPELLSNNYISIPYGAFSLIEYLFNDEYTFSRPFIIKNDANFERPSEILKEMVSSSEIIPIDDVISFAKENRIVSSQLELLNSFNDTHLLIDGSNLASIEYIGITAEIVELVESSIELEIRESMPISQLECIRKFPKIAVPWNAWLVYSIVNKWSKDLVAVPSSSQFKKAFPLIAPKSKSVSYLGEAEGFDHEGRITLADDLDKIDELIEDFLDVELEEMDEL